MWLKNNNTPKGKRNQTNEKNYVIVNARKGNPALRISEKARKELGWTEDDFLNVYIDSEKIMLMRDNETREFQLKIYQSDKKIYGFNIYGKTIKEFLDKLQWENKQYPAHVIPEGNEKMLVCYKNEFISKTELALLQKKQQFRKTPGRR